MSPTNTLRTALLGLSANKLRASLTMLGIIIGVASVIAMLALGNGARAAVGATFRLLGSDNIQITTKTKLVEGEYVETGQILSYADGLVMPEEVPLVDRVEMLVEASARVRYGRNTLDMEVTGTTPDTLASLGRKLGVQPAGGQVEARPGDLLHVDNYLARGRFFTLEEVATEAPVCVLGAGTAEQLFAGEDPLEASVWINRQRCLVVGVLVDLEMSDPEQQGAGDPNLALFMPISAVLHGLYEEEPSVAMTAHVRDERRIEEARQQITAFLRTRHNIEAQPDGTFDDDFALTSRSDVLGAQQKAAGAFAALLAAMAAVSLLVGGIGIMNVMLVSVSERTGEIGLRVAVGARSRDIVLQFLLEAALIGLAGGILGIAAGILAAPLAARLNDGVALLAPGSIPLAFSVALLTGILFGLYPAWGAARLDPIAALRHE